MTFEPSRQFYSLSQDRFASSFDFCVDSVSPSSVSGKRDIAIGRELPDLRGGWECQHGSEGTTSSGQSATTPSLTSPGGDGSSSQLHQQGNEICQARYNKLEHLNASGVPALRRAGVERFSDEPSGVSVSALLGSSQHPH